MKTRTFTRLMLLPLAFVALMGISGCEKDKETIATILVVSEDGMPVTGATVRIFSNPSAGNDNANELRFDMEGVTNGTGKVTFDFSEYYKKGQAGFAVLDLEGWKGSLYGVGIIKVEEETTTEQTLTIE